MARVRLLALIGLTFVIFLLVSVQILVLPVSVRTVQNIFQVDQTSGLSSQVVDRVTQASLQYLSQREEDEKLLSAYNKREVTHLVEVHRRFWQARLTLLILVVAVLAGAGFGWWREVNLNTVFGWVVVMNGILGVATFFIFPILFMLFHRFLFAPGTYFFSESDLLVRLFPYEFWWLMGAMVTILTEFWVGIAWFITRRVIKFRSATLESTDFSKDQSG